MDLILHIGLPKTATTTLQRHYFASLPGNLAGPKQPQPREDPSALGDSAHTRVSTKDRSRLKAEYVAACRGQAVDLTAWRERVLEAVGPRRPDRVILSHEGLADWRRASQHEVAGSSGAVEGGTNGPTRRWHPIADFIHDLVVPAWQPLGAVRVLLTLRNQMDWLASHYGQASNRIIGASRADFERQVRRVIASDNLYLDFAALVGALHRAVGEDRVTVLLTEQMSLPAYWDTLSTLVGSQLVQVAPTVPRANVRSSAAGWQLRPYDRVKYPPRYPIVRRFSGPRKKINSLPTVVGFRNPVGLEWASVRRRRSMMQPSERLREQVRARYRDSNHRLGQLLGADLSHLGY